jgi:hypothetical protein
MDMIGQQAVAQKRDFFQITVRNQLIQVSLAVAIVFENVLAIVTPAYDVVNGTGIFNAERPCHASPHTRGKRSMQYYSPIQA